MHFAGSLGLRPRLVLALVLTGALTLGVAAFTLLSPLERRLRDDEIENLVRSAEAARGSLAQLDRSQLRPGTRRVTLLVRSVARRVNAQAVLVDTNGRIVAGTDVDPGDRAAEARQAVRQRRTVKQTPGEGGDAQASVGVPVPTKSGVYGLELRKTLDDVSAAVAVVRRAMITAALVGIVAALLVGVGLAGRLVHRLRALRDTALRVARLGPVVEMAPDNARDEVADLTRAFAVMQERLREQEEARRTFVATASHELRTPLTSLRLMLDLLREELEGDDIDLNGARDGLDRASRQADRLGALAAQLLDLSRLDAGVPLRRELIELREASRAVIAEFAARGQETGRPIRLGSGSAIWAVGDPGAVAQIVRVLLDNALHFGPRGQPIEVALTADTRAVALQVTDHGPGVPVDERQHIFERFWRGSQALGESGFGLGLAIARELARRMDGDLLIVDSPGGARFELRLVPAPAVQVEG